MNSLAFLGRHIRPLAFGALHSFYSAPGQTFCIGLFVASFTETLGIGPADVGALYLGATLASAAALLFVGHWIDHVRLVHFSAAVIVVLAAACFVTAAASGPVTLFVALFLLRLSGQGLMTHVEATATARAFDRDRGRALGIVALGFPLSEVAFPPLIVVGLTIVGWRSTYAIIGVVALIVVLPLTQWLLRTFQRSPRGAKTGNGAGQRLIEGLKTLAASRYVWLSLPALALYPFYGTAIMFHITTIARLREWPDSLIAASFPLMAIAGVAGLVVSGYAIDRVTARRLFLVQSLPLLVGIAILAASAKPWALPLGLAIIGFGNGIARTTMTAMWAEVFGTESLGTIRSTVVMYLVFASALAPFVFGAALAAGWTVTGVLTLFVAVGIILMIPPLFAGGRA